VTVYFVTGHREMPLKSDKVTEALTDKSNASSDLEMLVEYLQHNFIKALSIDLSGRDKMPADASLVVIAGPKTDISDAERELLAKYLEQGGKMMFWLNPDVPQVGSDVRSALKNISLLLAGYGVSIPSEMVTLPLQSEKKNDLFNIPVIPKDHRVTKTDGFSELNLLFTQARPILINDTRPQNTILEPIFVSPKEAYNVPIEQFTRMYLTGEQPDIRIRQEDLKPQCLGVAITRLMPGASEDKAARIVVTGNASCLSSRYISQGSLLIFLNAVNWLTNAGDLIAIPEPTIENTPVELTAGQQQFLFILLVIAVPAVIGLGGLGYAISRRGHLNNK